MNKLHSDNPRFCPAGATVRIDARGFSYIEVVVSVLLIAIVLVPATDLLSSGLLGSRIHQDQASAHYRLVAKMEEVLAQSLTDLRQQADNAGNASVSVDAYSDGVGAYQRRLVYLSYYDVDNADGDDNGFTGTDLDLLWLKVQIEGSNMQAVTLVGIGR